MQPPIERIDVSSQELEAWLEQARQQPLPEDGYQKLRAAVRTLAYVTQLLDKQETTLAELRELLCPASTEKTAKVLAQAGIRHGRGEAESAAEEAGDRPRAQWGGRVFRRA